MIENKLKRLFWKRVVPNLKKTREDFRDLGYPNRRGSFISLKHEEKERERSCF